MKSIAPSPSQKLKELKKFKVLKEERQKVVGTKTEGIGWGLMKMVKTRKPKRTQK